LVQQTRTRELRENAARPMPRSAQNLVLHAVALIVVVTAGLLAAAAVPHFVRPTWLWWPLWIVELIIGAVLRRQRKISWYGHVWIGGISTMLAILAVDVIASTT
jgi:FtsH-binding integral membrane protein